MKRTRVYLEEDLWKFLGARADEADTTVSELVRQAVRERYIGNLEKRKKAMQAIVGLWRDRQEFEDSEAYIRSLRGGERPDRLN